jgi:cbb3-type cytochrome oxidase maturation protein
MSAVDGALFATVIGSIVLFGGAAVLAFGWAVRSGQFENFSRGARSIFGPDEPVGESTDAFPGAAPAPHSPDTDDDAGTEFDDETADRSPRDGRPGRMTQKPETDSTWSH